MSYKQFCAYALYTFGSGDSGKLFPSLAYTQTFPPFYSFIKMLFSGFTYNVGGRESLSTIPKFILKQPKHIIYSILHKFSSHSF